MVVYWSPFNSKSHKQKRHYYNYGPPQPLLYSLKNFSDNLDHTRNEYTKFLKCPSVRDYSLNVFGIQSPIKLSFKWTGNEIITFNHNQEFFDNNILIRDISNGFFSFEFLDYVFFAEEDLKIKQFGAFFEDNEFCNNTMVIPGMYDVSKWYRNIELAFALKKNSKDQIINVNQGDVLYYLNFDTKEKITFKKFFMTEQLYDFVFHTVNLKIVNDNKNLKNYFDKVYSIFDKSKSKNYILKIIKENLMD